MSDLLADLVSDPSVLQGLDKIAVRTGQSRDEVARQSIRRSVARETLRDSLASVEGRDAMSEGEAVQIAAEEKRASRQSSN